MHAAPLLSSSIASSSSSSSSSSSVVFEMMTIGARSLSWINRWNLFEDARQVGMVCRRSTRAVRGGCDEALPDVDISFYKRPRVPCVAVIERLDSNFSRLIIHASGPNSTAPSALQGGTTSDPDLMPIKARVLGEGWGAGRVAPTKG